MASENLLNYIWETQILPQAGYSFSRLHSVGYSLIALQEMNLAHYYPQVYWNTACLSVNAGADENNDDNKGTKYGKVATAIENMKRRGIQVDLPDINKAGFGFKPNVETNSIIFGLKGLNGIGDDLVHLIIENRPYHSFEDFISRMYDTKIVKKKQMIQLIKGGCFESFGDRKEIMRKFINHIFEPKEKLTMANFKQIIELGLVPEKFKLNVRFFRFKDYISKFIYKTIQKPKDKLLILDDISAQFLNEHFSEECIKDVIEGRLVISEKQFKKEYDKKMECVKEWLSQEETLKLFNNQLLELEWEANASGTISEWEMSSLSFYHSEHELVHLNKDKYGVSNFFELPEEPKVIGTNTNKGIERPIYELTRIVGTVLDKDKNKHTITLLTTEGVVTVKFYAGNFSWYNKQISEKGSDGKKTILESSWFTRGNKLLITGFRRGNQFIPRTYKDSIYKHTVALIKEIDHEGNLSLQTERTMV